MIEPKDAYSFDTASKKLTLRNASEFPANILSLADEVEILDLSVGRMTTLPAEFSLFINLKILFLSHHNFTEIPPVLAECKKLEMLGMKGCKITHLHGEHLPQSLRALILTDNQIREITPGIGKLKNLQKLSLTGNQIAELPREILACDRLELIRLAVNHFTELPNWLLQLPNLAWYGDSGNAAQTQVQIPEPTIEWSGLEVGEEIGRSQKNVVYKARFGDQDVAVKLYGDDLTADGTTDDEINAHLLIGDHDHLIGCLGEIKNVPNGKRATMLRLIPGNYHTLAAPPNFVTQTRDVYTSEFEPEFIKNALSGVASAMQYMHGRGIMHGDMYAHNILVDQTGHAYVGDFGAASLYDPALGRDREFVEIRAFAYLMEELLDRCKDRPDELVRFKDALLNDPKDYSFARINKLLAEL